MNEDVMKVKMPTPRDKSKKQEKRLAKEIKGRTTIASGAFWHDKGDVSNDRFLIEAKRTDKEKYTVKRDIWEKIRIEAVGCGKIPLLVVEMQDLEVVCLTVDDYVTLAGDTMQTIIIMKDKQFTLIKSVFERYPDLNEFFRFKDSDLLIVLPKNTFFKRMGML
jgi:hypothetical protein